MPRRRSVEVEGLTHGAMPIPAASIVDNLLVSGGISGRSVATGQLPESLADQCQEMFANVGRVVAAVGGRLEDIVSMQVHLTDRSARDAVNREWLVAFPDPASRPARHTLTTSLPDGVLVQCQVVAMLPSAGPSPGRPPHPDPVVEAFRRLPTAAISDALDRFSIPGQCLGLAPIDPAHSLAGRAFTVRYRPAGVVERGTVGDYIDDVPPRSVVVLDNEGRLDCTVWGDILTGVAHRRGLGGTVINGVCRDVARAGELSYPLFSRGRFMRTGKDRVEVDRVEVPVSLGTVQVRPGDIVIGDGDGVVVVPRAHEAELLAAAIDIDEAEQAIEVAVAAGSRLDDARKAFRYHQLQGEPGQVG